ncbi:MAG: HAD family hydrolase [Candidatus Aenigmatarchaeota archaeon]
MPEAVIFDWDGVIVDSLGVTHDWLNYCCEQFGKDYPFSDPEGLRRNFREPFTELYESFGFNWEEDKGKIIELFHDYMRQQDVPLKGGIKNVLEELHTSRHILGIVSSNREEVISEKLEQYGLKKYFTSVVTHSQVGEHLKPDPKMIKVCVERMARTPEDAVYVGDQPTDIQAAHRAGVKSVGVTWGFRPRKDLEAENPDYIVTKPREIVEAIKSEL